MIVYQLGAHSVVPPPEVPLLAGSWLISFGVLQPIALPSARVRCVLSCTRSST